MCTELLERNFEVLPEQNVAIVRTLDDRTHYVPLQSFGDSLFEKKRAATLACPLLRELTVLEEDGSVAMYGANDIVAPVRIRMAKDILGTFQAVHSGILAKRSGHVTALDEFPDVQRSPVETADLVKNLSPMSNQIPRARPTDEISLSREAEAAGVRILMESGRVEHDLPDWAARELVRDMFRELQPHLPATSFSDDVLRPLLSE